MTRYYFVTDVGDIYIKLPLSVSKITIGCIARDIRAKQCYYYVNRDVKVFIDLSN